MTQSNKNYLHGATVLAAAVAVVKIIGAVYRIPIANILGDVGMSTFQVSFSIYQFLLIVSTAGLPVALSKLVAAADALERPAQVRRVFVVGRNTFVALGTVSFLIMALFHRQLATISGSPSAAYGILALSPAVFFVGLISAYRGYCQGLSDMVPTSVSQVIEAVVRLGLGLGLAWLFHYWGWSSAITVAGAILGVTVGTALAAGYLFFAKRRVDRHRRMRDGLDVPDSNRRISRNLLNIAVPLTLGASIFSLINIINNAVILRRLQSVQGLAGAYLDEAVAYLAASRPYLEIGAAELSYIEAGLRYVEAQRLHGTYSMILPLFNLPSAFIIPITVALIPAISAFLTQGDGLRAKATAESGIRVTCLLAMPAGAGLMVLAGPVMDVLFYGRFAAQGPGLLVYMGAAAFFICFFQATNCVLQAYGFQRYTMYTLPIGGAISVGLNWILLGDPNITIYGAAISTVACYVIISVMNLVLVKRNIPDPPSFRKILIRPFACTVVMAVAARAVYGLLSGILLDFPAIAGQYGIAGSTRLPLTISLVGAIGLAMVVYLALIIATRALTKEDMHMLPKGEKLAKILRVH